MKKLLTELSNSYYIGGYLCKMRSEAVIGVRGCHKGVGKAIKYLLYGESRSALSELTSLPRFTSPRYFPHPAPLRGSGQRKNPNVRCKSLYPSYELLHCAPAKLMDFFIALRDQNSSDYQPPGKRSWMRPSLHFPIEMDDLKC